jgi:methylated-DNA-[protein]-cysteine S-methyltransferase
MSCLELVVDRVPSPVGTILLVCDAEGRVRSLDFDECEARMHRLLRRHYGADACTLNEGRAPSAVIASLAAFFAGDLDAIVNVAVATGGTEFQRRVWAALRRIPAGATTTYGELATTIGSPGACRAVGLANGSNPVAVVVPCHRVIGADGTLTGYGGGLPRKRWLLAHEREWAGVGQRAFA